MHQQGRCNPAGLLNAEVLLRTARVSGDKDPWPAGAVCRGNKDGIEKLKLSLVRDLVTSDWRANEGLLQSQSPTRVL